MNSFSNSNVYANIYRGSFMPLKAIEVPSDLYHDLPENLRSKLDALLEYSPDAEYGCGSSRRYENFERDYIDARKSLIEHYATLSVDRYANLTIEKVADIFLETIKNGDIAKIALLLKIPKINDYKNKIIENCAFFAFTHLQKLAEEKNTEMFAFLLRDAKIAPIITKAKHKNKEISPAIDAAIKYNAQIEEGYKLGKFLVLMKRSYPHGIPSEISEHMASSDKFALDAFNCFVKRESINLPERSKKSVTHQTKFWKSYQERVDAMAKALTNGSEQSSNTAPSIDEVVRNACSQIKEKKVPSKIEVPSDEILKAFQGALDGVNKQARTESKTQGNEKDNDILAGFVTAKKEQWKKRLETMAYSGMKANFLSAQDDRLEKLHQKLTKVIERKEEQNLNTNTAPLLDLTQSDYIKDEIDADLEKRRMEKDSLEQRLKDSDF